MIRTWTLPNQSKIHQIKRDIYRKVHNKDPNVQTKNKVTLERATQIFLNKPSTQKLRTEPTLPIELYDSPEDQTLDRILNLCQYIGYNSTKLLRKHKRETNIKKLYRKDPEHERYIIKYVTTQESPDNNQKQQKLRALKTLNYLVDNASNNTFNDNKVTENDKDYKAIKNIALHQNEEKEHIQKLARAILASIKQQG